MFVKAKDHSFNRGPIDPGPLSRPCFNIIYIQRLLLLSSLAIVLNMFLDVALDEQLVARSSLFGLLDKV